MISKVAIPLVEEVEISEAEDLVTVTELMVTKVRYNSNLEKDQRP